MDALFNVALQRAMRTRDLSAEIEVQFSHVQGGRPVVEIWRRLRTEAAEAMTALVLVDAENITKVRDLQRKVLQFDDFVRITKEIHVEGIEADKAISAAELDELREELMGTEEGEETAAALGLTERAPNDI